MVVDIYTMSEDYSKEEDRELDEEFGEEEDE